MNNYYLFDNQCNTNNEICNCFCLTTYNKDILEILVIQSKTKKPLNLNNIGISVYVNSCN